jgi:hypothetical protein
MKRKQNMTKILKFVFTIILFISLFLTTNGTFSFYPVIIETDTKCKSLQDCYEKYTKHIFFLFQCRSGFCLAIFTGWVSKLTNAVCWEEWYVLQVATNNHIFMFSVLDFTHFTTITLYSKMLVMKKI